MPQKPRWNAKRRQVFLNHLAETANVTASAAAAGMYRSSAYHLRSRDDDFAKAWDDAMNVALDALEDALMKRAKDGVEKPQYYGGKEVGTVTSYSDNVAMFLLRSKRPDVYGDAKDIKSANRGGALKDRDPLKELETKLDGIEQRLKANDAGV